MVILVLVIGLAVAGVVGTVAAVRRDGYRREPIRPHGPDGPDTLET